MALLPAQSDRVAAAERAPTPAEDRRHDHPIAPAELEPADPQKEETIREICQIYRQAPEVAKEGERTMSTDELTGVQALERKHAGLPLAPGKVERREFDTNQHTKW